MLRIANLTVDPMVLDHFPESVAKEECILPLGFRGTKLCVIVGRRPDAELRRALEKAAFITDLPLSYSLGEPDRVKALIDELYSCVSDIANCEVEFKFRCPRAWLQLRPTEESSVRYCEECKQSVYLCKDEAEANDQTRRGRCVAVLRDDEFIDVGLLRFPDEEVD